MNILENKNWIFGIVVWVFIISILLINDYIKKKKKINFIDDIHFWELGAIVLMLAPFKWLFDKINNRDSLYKKVKVRVIGPKIISEDPKETTFVMLASRTGKNKGIIYKSSEYTAPKDDLWLQGQINGLEIIALISKTNSKKYTLNFDDVPQSQYS